MASPPKVIKIALKSFEYCEGWFRGAYDGDFNTFLEEDEQGPFKPIPLSKVLAPLKLLHGIGDL